MSARVIAIIFMVVLSLVAAGCNGAKETDEVAYIVAMGLDAGQDGKLKVTYLVALPQAVGGQDSGKGGEKPPALLTFEGENLAETRGLLNSSLSRTSILSHVKAIIIGEELARKGLARVTSPFMRYREYRGSMFLIVANRTTAQRLLSANKPIFETLQSKFFESMMLKSVDNSFFPRTNIHEFYVRLKSNSAAPIIALFGLNPGNGGHAVGEIMPPEKDAEYIAGAMPRQGGGGSVEAVGTAVFKGDKLVGLLTSEETRAMAIVHGDFDRGFVVVEDPLMPKENINCYIRLGSSPKIKVVMTDGRPVIDVTIKIEAEITSIGSGISYETGGYREQLEAQVSKVLEQQVTNMLIKTRDLQTDVVGFGYQARACFPTYRDYMAVDWATLYGQAEFKVAVSTRVRRTGLMWRSSGMRPETQ
ncbi:Spore germination protein B3 [Sporomusa carbonis]|uniref:Ger(x)C family spore germination protein n=1 Tax=Sporomusa carbonis TaxID=3076075 RepID=UPI003A6F1187